MQSPSENDVSPALRDTHVALVAQLADAAAMSTVTRAAAASLRASRDAFIVSELIGDVVADTYSGEAPCKPGQTMTAHLVGEVRRRVARSRRATKNLISLESLAESLEPDPEDTEGEALHNARLDRLESMLTLLRARVRDDPALARMLAHHEAGAARSAAVVRDGMSRREYINTRRRLIAAAQAIDRSAQLAEGDECAEPGVDSTTAGNESAHMEVPLTDAQREAAIGAARCAREGRAAGVDHARRARRTRPRK